MMAVAASRLEGQTHGGGDEDAVPSRRERALSDEIRLFLFPKAFIALRSFADEAITAITARLSTMAGRKRAREPEATTAGAALPLPPAATESTTTLAVDPATQRAALADAVRAMVDRTLGLSIESLPVGDLALLCWLLKLLKHDSMRAIRKEVAVAVLQSHFHESNTPQQRPRAPIQYYLPEEKPLAVQQHQRSAKLHAADAVAAQGKGRTEKKGDKPAEASQGCPAVSLPSPADGSVAPPARKLQRVAPTGRRTPLAPTHGNSNHRPNAGKLAQQVMGGLTIDEIPDLDDVSVGSGEEHPTLDVALSAPIRLFARPAAAAAEFAAPERSAEKRVFSFLGAFGVASIGAIQSKLGLEKDVVIAILQKFERQGTVMIEHDVAYCVM